MDLRSGLRFDDSIDASFGMGHRVDDAVEYGFLYQFELRDDKGGLVLSTEFEKNIVVNGGIDYLLANGVASADLYAILLGASPTLSATTAIGDITELTTNFSQTVRPTYVDVVSGQSSTNAASRAHWDFTGPLTLGGAGLVAGSSALGNTGSTTLVSARALSAGNQAVANGWTLDLTVVIGGSDGGS